MQSISESSGKEGFAASRFEQAFERILSGKTKVLPRGARLTQANVAREAGVDPSAFRKGRYPELIAKIQKHTRADSGANDDRESTRIAKLNAETRILKARADLETSKLISLYAEYMAVKAELESIKAGLESGKLKYLKPK